jgi:hypothetical protein
LELGFELAGDGAGACAKEHTFREQLPKVWLWTTKKSIRGKEFIFIYLGF